MPNVGTLVILRHGESTLNAQGRFTGLLDPVLTPRGREEVRHAGETLTDLGFIPQIIFSSTMSRAVESANLVNALLTAGTVPVLRAWELNERNYGSLTGRSRTELLRKFGPEVLHQWRRSMHQAPPPMTGWQLESIRASPALATMPASTILKTESLDAVVTRVRGLWSKILRPALVSGSNVLVIGHGNSLRALCMLIDSLSEDEVERLNLPTGQPLHYSFQTGCVPCPRGGIYLNPGAAAHAASVLAMDGGT